MNEPTKVEILPAIREKINPGSLAIKGVGAVAVIGGVGFLLPVFVNAFMGGMTLLGIGIIALVGTGLAKSVGYFGQVLDNRILGLRKKEARDNPIEQMQNELIASQQIFDKKKIALTEFASEIRNMKDDLKQSKEEFPDEDWSADESTIDETEHRYQDEQTRLGEIEESLRKSTGLIKVMERRLHMAKSLGKVNAPDRTSKEEIESQIFLREAVNSIRSQLNSVMSATQVEAGLRKSRLERIENGKKK